MSGRVIQARYLGGRPGPQLLQMRPVGAPPLAGAIQAKGQPGLAGPPPLAGQALQARGAPVLPSRALQARGAAESFAVDPVRLGLGQGRGRPLPDAVRAKMEAAFSTDFSGVRVHEGPQAARIGAIAFTTGHDIYFAPGQYRPETVQGQQLLGHELAHVVQQRQGRVKAPGIGVSVVQDHALEAEADRLGMRAALQRMVGEVSSSKTGSARINNEVCLQRHLLWSDYAIKLRSAHRGTLQRAEMRNHDDDEYEEYDQDYQRQFQLESENEKYRELAIEASRKENKRKSDKTVSFKFDDVWYHIWYSSETPHVTIEGHNKIHYFFEGSGMNIKDAHPTKKEIGRSKYKKVKDEDGNKLKLNTKRLFSDLPRLVQRYIMENHDRLRL